MLGIGLGTTKSRRNIRFARWNLPASIAKRYITDFPGFTNISWFDSGHVFAKFGATGTVANDAGVQYAMNGTSHNTLKISTDGTVNFTDVRGTIAGINATGKILAVAVYCPNFANVSEFQVTVGGTSLTNRRRWGAIQGNQGNRYLRGSEWQVITLPWQGGTDAGSGAPRTAVTDYQFRLQSNGTGVVDMWIGGFAWITVPSGKATVSFDDGYDSLYTKAWPKLSELSIKFTGYIPAGYVDTANRLTLTQIRTMLSSGLFEVGYHGTGNDQRVNTAAQVRTLIETDLTYWFSKGITVKTAAYPGGEEDLTTDSVPIRDIYAEYFESARMIFQGQGETTPPPDYLRLRVDPYVTNAVTTSAVQTSITNALNNGGIHHQVYHEIVDATADITTKYLTADFNTNMTNLNNSGLTKVTVSDSL